MKCVKKVRKDEGESEREGKMKGERSGSECR